MSCLLCPITAYNCSFQSFLTLEAVTIFLLPQLWEKALEWPPRTAEACVMMSCSERDVGNAILSSMLYRLGSYNSWWILSVLLPARTALWRYSLNSDLQLSPDSARDHEGERLSSEEKYDIYDDLGRTPPRTRISSNRKWRDHRKHLVDMAE